MLDLDTALIFLFAVSAVDGLLAIAVWATQRHVTGLAMIAFALLAFSVAVGMISLTGVAGVTARNILFNLAQIMGCEGTAAFLGRRRLAWAPATVVAVTLVFWPAAQILLPEAQSLPLRVIVSAAIGMLIMARMAWLMLTDKTQSLALRLITVGCLAGIITLLLFRVHFAATTTWSSVTGQFSTQAWFVFGICIGANLLFFCLLTMVAARLSQELQRRNCELDKEIGIRTNVEAKLSQALNSELRLREDRRQFLHVLGHELNTPLAVISSSAQMIQRFSVWA